jgi:hypothetical protein
MTSLPRLAVVCLVLLTLSAGCGRETYLERLDETKRFFAYEDRLNQNLTRVAWRGQSFLLRVPKQFQPIVPKSKPGAEGEDRDPRQPTFAELDLPGLQGAWQASLPLTGGEGNGPAWLYLCSNFEALGKKGAEDKAAAFNSDLIVKIATAVGQQHQTPSYAKLPNYEIPPKGQEAFVDKLKFRVASPGIPLIFDDKAYHIRIYCYKKDKSPAQISIIYVLPDNVVQAAKLDRAIDMSLETLQVTQEKPLPATSQGGKGKPAGNSKSF